ncbi:hypothetical protein [Couchioplanes caeruleus]|uniref:hypothetical protein n=1 Tax=Couchioplanes caeruleus TaxID=56438 RepID=UPI0011607C51|nr:hypothetical protein [Couchioplanes caeruleus]
MSENNENSFTLAALTTKFTDEVGRKPFLGELIEVLGWATYGAFPAPLTFSAKLKNGEPYVCPNESAVADLNDSIFVNAAAFIAHLVESSKDEALSPSKLAPKVMSGLKDPAVLLRDVTGEEVARLTVSGPKKISKPRIGDLLAIPSDSGKFRLASIVARNRFGTALGIFGGTVDVPRPVGASLASAIFRVPFYTEDRLVATGAWKVVGHDEDLLALFPSDPEIYHGTDLQWPGVDLGEFGAAEKASGEIRLIGSDEAREVGLLDGTYRQSYIAEDLERMLNEADRRK